MAAEPSPADAGGSLPVFLTSALPDGERAFLDGEEGRHAANVRRMRQGEWLLLGDGLGELAECVVEAIRTGRDAEVELTLRRRWSCPLPQLRVTVAQALVKGERGELAVELATEAGADAIVPWRADRSIARWDEGPRGAKALQRWRRTARAAAKQARRGWVPEVREPVGLDGLAELVNGAAGALLLDGAAPGGFADVGLPATGELVLIVGPEGGCDDAERIRLSDSGATRCRLGSTVLRASTAAAVALGAIGARTTRWS